MKDIIVILKNGVCKVTKVVDKTFVGSNILYAGVWKKGDDRRVFNLAYLDGASGKTFVKRFSVTAVTRDKEYPLDQGNKGSKMLYLTNNPNGETETI